MKNHLKIIKNFTAGLFLAIVALLLIVFVLSAFLPHKPYNQLESFLGPLAELTKSGKMQNTPDGEYGYSLLYTEEAENNRYVQLYLREIHTGEDFAILLSVDENWIDYVCETKFELISAQVYSLIPTDSEGVYIFTFSTNELLSNVEYTFEINMKDRIAINTTTEFSYNSAHTGINYNLGVWQYVYYLELIETYQNGEEVSIEILLNIKTPEGRVYSFPLPIDEEILAEPHLREATTADPPIWIIMEEIEETGQFIVRTNEEFSTEIALTFLVDVYAGTAEEITVEQTV